MGDVIYLDKPEAAPSASSQAGTANPVSAKRAFESDSLTDEEIRRLETIRDSIEDLLNMVAGVRRDPEAVALAASRFGIMRMVQLHGRDNTLAFVQGCIETAEMAEDMFQS